MRISTAWSQQLNVKAMQNQQAKMVKTELQLASALKNLTPADDPVAAAKALSLDSTLAQATQYQENINAAKTNNTLEDSTLSNAVDVLQRARDLAVQSLNSGTLQDTDKQAIGHEIDQILGNMQGLANTTNASGEYIFSGYQTKTAAFKEAIPATAPKTYDYKGGTEQRSLQVSADRQIADSDPGSDVFAFKDVNGNAQNIFNALSTFREALANPNPATDQAVLTKVLNDLDSGLQTITATQAKTGARLNALDVQQNQNEKYMVDMKSSLSNIQDLDYAEAMSRFNQQETTLQAAQQSFSKVQKLSLFDYL
ncbi:MAG: flagellar hook-associated protein FlgL [Methylococcaceae bacterium]|nr:flagellar hook-associated protein FlgL [Methylococcaceae bacterium]